MPASLDTWINRISEQELPVFKYTIHAINDVVASDDTSTAELAQIILRDASLTARILRVANSPLYNPSSSAINTVSRAIVFIGFNLVRDITLSLAVIDALLGGHEKQRVLQLMARAFHAAVQARMFAEQRGDDNPEIVFIAALLYHLGEIAFYCVSDNVGEQIFRLIEESGLKEDMAQKEVLGFTFDQLTVGLTRGWHLSDLLHSAINQPSLENPRIRDIVLSQKLAQGTAKSWHSEETKKIIQDISRHMHQSLDVTRHALQDTANHAVEMARLFGASAIIRYLPVSPQAQQADTEEETTEEEIFPRADHLLQLNILRDLAGMLEGKPNLNLVLETILEGIYRGTGMDRTLFAILSPDKSRLLGKYALGQDNRQFVTSFQLSLSKNPLFQSLFANRRPVWIKNTQSDEHAGNMDSQMRLSLASKAFYLGPVVIGSKPIGIIYADRQPSDRPLDQESFESFRHFCLQANLVIQQLAVPG